MRMTWSVRNAGDSNIPRKNLRSTSHFIRPNIVFLFLLIILSSTKRSEYISDSSRTIYRKCISDISFLILRIRNHFRGTFVSPAVRMTWSVPQCAQPPSRSCVGGGRDAWNFNDELNLRNFQFELRSSILKIIYTHCSEKNNLDCTESFIRQHFHSDP